MARFPCTLSGRSSASLWRLDTNSSTSHAPSLPGLPSLCPLAFLGSRPLPSALLGLALLGCGSKLESENTLLALGVLQNASLDTRAQGLADTEGEHLSGHLAVCSNIFSNGFGG